MPGAEVGVRVYLDRTPERHGEESDDFVIVDPPTDTTLPVRVRLSASDHFQIDNVFGELVVRTQDDRSTDATFTGARVVDAAPTLRRPHG